MGVTTPLGQLQGCSQGGKHSPMQDRSAQFSMSAADLVRRRTTYATMSPVSRTARAQATSDTDAFILARQEQLLLPPARLPLLLALWPDSKSTHELERELESGVGVV